MNSAQVGFMRSTYRAIKEFNTGLEDIIKAFPNATLKKMREYLTSGDNGDMDEELCKELDRLERIREKAIKDEMFFLSAKAKSKGRIVPEDILSGRALDPIFDPTVYEISPDFQIFEFLSWYSGAEIAQYNPRLF